MTARASLVDISERFASPTDSTATSIVGDDDGDDSDGSNSMLFGENSELDISVR